jgi:hypothetical protein
MQTATLGQLQVPSPPLPHHWFYSCTAHPPPKPALPLLQVTFVLCCLLLAFAAATYIYTRSRPVYLLNYHCFKPPTK